MQASKSIILLLCLVPAAALRGAGRHTQSGRVAADMRPEVVSQLLDSVEKKWTKDALMCLLNKTDEATAFTEMKASCVKVSSSIVQGSEGNKDHVVEYMGDVCSQKNQEMCGEFASGIESAMTDDEAYNRDSLDLSQFCLKFWHGAVAKAAQAKKKVMDDAEAQKAAEEKKREDEAAAEQKKQAEEEAAEAKKQAEDELAKAKSQTEAVKQVSESEAAANKTTASEVTNRTNQTASAPEKTVAAVTTTSTTAAPVEVNASAPAKAQELENATAEAVKMFSSDSSNASSSAKKQVAALAVKTTSSNASSSSSTKAPKNVTAKKAPKYVTELAVKTTSSNASSVKAPKNVTAKKSPRYVTELAVKTTSSNASSVKVANKSATSVKILTPKNAAAKKSALLKKA